VGSVVAVVILTAGFTVNEIVRFAVFDAESVTTTEVFEVPAAVGLPVITPAFEIFNPAGKASAFDGQSQRTAKQANADERDFVPAHAVRIEDR